MGDDRDEPRDEGLSDVRFVLVEPIRGGNVGSAARALKNFGFRQLVLVRPRFAADDAEAVRMAAHAADVLAGARWVDSLDEALEGSQLVVGTSARTGKQRHPHWRIDRLAPDLVARAAGASAAFVFGREDRGLTDEELDRCTHLVRFPTAESYPSLNLAQAVMLTAWELRRAVPDPSDQDPLSPAAHEAREAMHEHLERAMLAIGFVTPDTQPSIARRFRRILGRAELEDEDVRTLRGLARQTLWAAGRAGLVGAPDEDPQR